MRTGLCLAMSLALLFGVASAVSAQQQEVKSAEAGATAEADAPTAAQLRAGLHRTMAALIEAQAAEDPNPEKIKQLSDELQAVRAKLQSQRPAAPSGAGVCPWGGPGLGFGPAWGGRGRGRPRGVSGYGYGWGAGQGRRTAWGGGRGYGRGAGWGGGPGRGFGPGWGYVDQDRDGVCDNIQRARGWQQ